MKNINYIYHHGIKGQKWGRRRFQNEDGSLTPAGKERYGDDDVEELSRNLKKRAGEIESRAMDKDGDASDEYAKADELYTDGMKLAKNHVRGRAAAGALIGAIGTLGIASQFIGEGKKVATACLLGGLGAVTIGTIAGAVAGNIERNKTLKKYGRR